MRRTSTMLELLRARLRPALLAGVVVLSLALFPACAAPTLPLPPPTALVSAPDADGLATITGMTRPEAMVFAYNEEQMLGVIGVPDAAGNYTLRIAAVTGDTITVWQRIGTDDGTPVMRSVP